MNPPWLFCPHLGPGVVTIDESESRHALHSLRLRPGAKLTLFDGCGHVAYGTLQPAGQSASGTAARRSRGAAAGKRAATAMIAVERCTAVPPPGRTLTLLVAACKGPRLSWLVEKCTELGVTRLIFAEFERSVVHLAEGHDEKLQRIAIEACKQSGRAWLPQIDSGLGLEDAVGAVHSPLLVAHPDTEALPLLEWLRANPEPPDAVAGVIGPEGGLSPDEVEYLRSVGATFVRLGANILRVETAAIAAAGCWAASQP
jgi:16S rRNA (uracil1498-N3)-methyltransferase